MKNTNLFLESGPENSERTLGELRPSGGELDGRQAASGADLSMRRMRKIWVQPATSCKMLK